MSREKFYRLSIKDEDYLDFDKYESPMSAFKDIPYRISELMIDGYKFSSKRPFLITYEEFDLDDLNAPDEVYKVLLRVDATKLIVKK